MSTQNIKIMRLHTLPVSGWFALGILVLYMQISMVNAAEQSITSLDFSSLSGDNVQIHIGMNGPAVAPKVFQTENPARIALDFSGVKSGLDKKIFLLNYGAASSVNVVEVAGRTRVVINLTETMPFETKVDGNNIYVILKPNSAVSVSHKISPVAQKKFADRRISNLFPKQTIKNIDFRRGPNGEGRLLLALSEPNTVVDVKQRGGKVYLNFLNTRLPEHLKKSYDVTDFATPVQKILARPKGAGVSIAITPVNPYFEYASFQSEGMLTVELTPLSAAEKEKKLKEKFLYTGDKLSLNFQDIDVRSVLQILADFTELNIVASDSVSGAVTLRLNDVPWDQALELILKSKGLAKRKRGNVILVAPATEIIKIEKDELAAKKIVERLEPLKTEYIQINYAKAEDVRDILLSEGDSSNQSGGSRSSGGRGGGNRSGSGSGRGGSYDDDNFRLVSRRGTAIVDKRTNTLIVKDTAKQLEEIHKIIAILDIPIRQVLIESRIVIASTDFAQELGVKFGTAGKSGDLSVRATGAKADGSTFTNATTLLSDLGSAAAASSGGSLAMTLARGADYVLNLEISALEDNGDTELLSNPRVMTTDRVKAIIKQGVQIPFQTQSQDGPVTQLVDAVLELNVTPQITPSGSVIMELKIKKDAPGATPLQTGAAGGAGTIPIDTRSVETTVQVEDGETIVLGGIYEGTDIRTQNKVPWLAELPGIGWMFKKKKTDTSKKELLVFVTPKIVKKSLSVR